AMLGFGLATGMQLANIPMGIYLQLIVPQKIKGRVFSSLGLVASSLMPLGTIIDGVLYDIGGCWIINIVIGLSIVIVAVIVVNRKVLSMSEEDYGKAVAGGAAKEETAEERFEETADARVQEA